MYIFLIIVHVIVSLVLIALILLQAGKGGSLAETFGGGMAQNIFGTSASKVLTKATTICAVTFILTSIALGVLSTNKSQS
ncbi:MAG: preprotein translocase subunit SecG, partial [Candidatus Omnitrophota bacterium]|nr:preprotein translocase subunit SecG [Candidatus Omnitrophota bacterium]